MLLGPSYNPVITNHKSHQLSRGLREGSHRHGHGTPGRRRLQTLRGGHVPQPQSGDHLDPSPIVHVACTRSWQHRTELKRIKAQGSCSPAAREHGTCIASGRVYHNTSRAAIPRRVLVWRELHPAPKHLFCIEALFCLLFTAYVYHDQTPINRERRGVSRSDWEKRACAVGLPRVGASAICNADVSAYVVATAHPPVCVRRPLRPLPPQRHRRGSLACTTLAMSPVAAATSSQQAAAHSAAEDVAGGSPGGGNPGPPGGRGGGSGSHGGAHDPGALPLPSNTANSGRAAAWACLGCSTASRNSA